MKHIFLLISFFISLNMFAIDPQKGFNYQAVLREAFRMIGTGEEKVFSLDMSNEVAADQGMVCGGRMLVYVVDI